MKLTLHAAAAQLGLSKRSLDDYRFLIKKAQLRGFDFKKRRNDCFSLVRAFVKTLLQKRNSQGQSTDSLVKEKEKCVPKTGQTKKKKKKKKKKNQKGRTHLTSAC